MSIIVVVEVFSLGKWALLHGRQRAMGCILLVEHSFHLEMWTGASAISKVRLTIVSMKNEGDWHMHLAVVNGANTNREIATIRWTTTFQWWRGRKLHQFPYGSMTIEESCSSKWQCQHICFTRFSVGKLSSLKPFENYAIVFLAIVQEKNKEISPKNKNRTLK